MCGEKKRVVEEEDFWIGDGFFVGPLPGNGVQLCASYYCKQRYFSGQGFVDSSGFVYCNKACHHSFLTRIGANKKGRSAQKLLEDVVKE